MLPVLICAIVYYNNNNNNEGYTMTSPVSYRITEPTRSTIFLNDLTVVDHAYINDDGCIVGGSFNPSFEVSGTPNPVEKVVVDFSTIKHDIKNLIDQHVNDVFSNGFDHKMWMIAGFSNAEAKYLNESTSVRITTPAAVLTVPTDAVKVIPMVESMTPTYTDEYIGKALEEYLRPRMRELYPAIDLEIKCVNTRHIHTASASARENARPFRYVHGLKDSTSYGCNNIAHGHGSFITADTNPDDILAEIAADLDNTVFIRGENISAIESGSPDISLKYTTPRGYFSMTIDASVHKVVILNTETTVEFLAAYVKSRYGEQLIAKGVDKFYISEGLSKGAVETL